MGPFKSSLEFYPTATPPIFKFKGQRQNSYHPLFSIRLIEKAVSPSDRQRTVSPLNFGVNTRKSDLVYVNVTP